MATATSSINPQLFQRAASEGGCVDLSDRAKWRLSGGDRVRYLNGQVTHDVRLAASGSSLYACVTNVKGRIEGDLFIHAAADGESLLLDAEPVLQDTLGPRLEKYIIADDAELSDITGEWLLWHLFGEIAPGAWRMETEAAGGHVVEVERFGVSGLDLWLPAQSAQAAPLSALIHSSHALLSAAEAEEFRILRKIPRFPQELNAETFPAEAGLEKRAMSFTKGCYIGQEILSRIKTTGKMPRELIAWEAASPEINVDVGDKLFLRTEGEAAKVVGNVTSAARHPLTGRLAGLAYVKQAAASDSVLLVGNDVPKIDSSVTTHSLVHP